MDQTASLSVCKGWPVSLGDPRRSDPELSELLLAALPSVLASSIRASQAVAASGLTPDTGLGGVVPEGELLPGETLAAK